VESCELSFDDFRTPADSVLGGVEGQGFAHMNEGPGNRRIQVPPGRSASGGPRWTTRCATPERRGVRQADLAAPSSANYLADMATK